jgi:hypothetical protein
MSVKMHLVYGGELIDTQKKDFKDFSKVDVVGLFPDYASAYAAWKDAAHRTVDNAEMRYFIAHLHRLTDEASEDSAEAESA